MTTPHTIIGDGRNYVGIMAGVSSPSPYRPALSVYLGPALPRWQPRTVDDVQGAIDDGTLRERHWLDVKAEVGSAGSAKKALARDLASFANDGGGFSSAYGRTRRPRPWPWTLSRWTGWRRRLTRSLGHAATHRFTSFAIPSPHQPGPTASHEGSCSSRFLRARPLRT